MSSFQVQMVHPEVIRAERRRFRRLKASVQAELRVEGKDIPIRTETSDLSEGGCYIEMPITIESGARLHVVLWLDQERVGMEARVVTCHPQFGNGIEFTAMPADCRDKLRRYLDMAQLAAERTPGLNRIS